MDDHQGVLIDCILKGIENKLRLLFITHVYSFDNAHEEGLIFPLVAQLVVQSFTTGVLIATWHTERIKIRFKGVGIALKAVLDRIRDRGEGC